MTTKRLAQIIAKVLFTYGDRCAKRLVLFSADGKDQGGWCKLAVEMEIEKLLDRHIKKVKGVK